MRGNAQTSAARIMLKRHRNFYMRLCWGSSPCRFRRSMITIDHRLGTSHLIRIRRSSILCSLNPRHRSRRWWNNNSSRSHDFGTRTSHHRFPRRSTNRRFSTNTTHSHRTIVNTQAQRFGVGDLFAPRANAWNCFPSAAACHAATAVPAEAGRYLRGAKADIPGAFGRTGRAAKKRRG